jgi:preprotein translocase subunit YajC
MPMFNVISLFAAAQKSGSGSLLEYLFIVPIFAAMYFLLIRPQQKRAREAKQLQSSLAEGDHVLLNSGIYGYISQIEEDKPYIWFEANTGVEFRINRSAVAGKTPDPAKPDAEQK